MADAITNEGKLQPRMSKRPSWRFVVSYSFILILAITTVLVRLSKPEIFSPALNFTLFLISVVLITLTWESLQLINKKLDQVLPFERGIATRIAVQLVLGTLLLLGLRFLAHEFGEPLLSDLHLDSLFLAATWVVYVLAGAIFNMIFFTEYFIEHWKESIRKAERLEREKTQVQFDNLKNQLNPHFLFNALTSLNSLISENQELASQFLQHMSKVYRYVLLNKEKNFVSLQTEADFIRNYVFLAETRFGGALKINFNIAEDAMDRAIVPVTLQILIENSIKHNIIDHEKKLVIDVFTQGEYLVISNNLQRRKTVETSNKQGLDNLRSLYRFLSDHPLIVEETADCFNVKVPLI